MVISPLLCSMYVSSSHLHVLSSGNSVVSHHSNTYQYLLCVIAHVTVMILCLGMFLSRNINMLTCSADSLFRKVLTILPPWLKSLSDGTLVPQMHRYLRANDSKTGNFFPLQWIQIYIYWWIFFIPSHFFINFLFM